MKKITVVGTMVWLVLGLTVGIYAFQDEPEGFRDLKWGDPPTWDMVDTESANAKEDVWNDCFYRPDDKMAIGSVSFFRIVYSFYYSEPPKLMSVTLSFSEVDEYETLKMVLEAKFGKATKSTKPLFAYKEIWKGETTIIELNCPIFGHKYLKFYSPEILAEKKKTDKRKEIEEAQDDF